MHIVPDLRVYNRCIANPQVAVPVRPHSFGVINDPPSCGNVGLDVCRGPATPGRSIGHGDRRGSRAHHRFGLG